MIGHAEVRLLVQYGFYMGLGFFLCGGLVKGLTAVVKKLGRFGK